MTGQQSRRTDSILITDSVARQITEIGGYTHPLFNPEVGAESPDTSASPPPLPGQGTLLFAGGLLEQSGMLDHAIALLELKSVKFQEMVRPGDSIYVELEEMGSKITSKGHKLQEYMWTVFKNDHVPVAVMNSLMLMNNEKGETE